MISLPAPLVSPSQALAVYDTLSPLTTASWVLKSVWAILNSLSPAMTSLTDHQVSQANLSMSSQENVQALAMQMGITGLISVYSRNGEEASTSDSFLNDASGCILSGHTACIVDLYPNEHTVTRDEEGRLNLSPRGTFLISQCLAQLSQYTPLVKAMLKVAQLVSILVAPQFTVLGTCIYFSAYLTETWYSKRATIQADLLAIEQTSDPMSAIFAIETMQLRRLLDMHNPESLYRRLISRILYTHSGENRFSFLSTEARFEDRIFAIREAFPEAVSEGVNQLLSRQATEIQNMALSEERAFGLLNLNQSLRIFSGSRSANRSIPEEIQAEDSDSSSEHSSMPALMDPSDDRDLPDLEDQVRNYLSEGHHDIIIYGGMGTGRTDGLD